MRMRAALLQPSGCQAPRCPLVLLSQVPHSLALPLLPYRRYPPPYPWCDSGGLCIPVVTPELVASAMPDPHAGLPLPWGHHSPQASLVSLDPDAGTRPWIPTPLADLALIRKAVIDSGPDSLYFDQVPKQWTMHLQTYYG